MFNSFIKSLKNKFSLSKPRQQRTRFLELDSLESRVNPSQIVEVTFVNGSLIFKSGTSGGETTTFDISQVSSQSNFLQLQGFSGTTFEGTVNLFSSGYGTAQAQINTLNLNGFNKIQVLGGNGNDNVSFGDIDGNVIGDISQTNFGFNIDTYSVNAGSSNGTDTLSVNGRVGLKEDGEFVTDITPAGQIFVSPGKNLNNIALSPLGSINSTGSGRVRLVADRNLTSTIDFQPSAAITAGSGDVFLQAGSLGTINLNGNQISTNGGAINLASNLLLNASSGFSTGATGQTTNGVNFQGVSGVSVSGQALDVQSRGPVVFNGDVGSTIIPLGAVSIGSANTQLIPGKIALNNLYAKSLAAYSSLEFTSAGILDLNYVDGLTIQTTNTLSQISLGIQNSLTPAIQTANLGSVNINNAGNLFVNSNIVSSGSFTQAGSGNVTLGSDGVSLTLAISTDSNAITFNAPITLKQSVNVSSNSSGLLGGGSGITFNSTIDGLFLMQLTAGVGNISFNDVLGGTTPLDAVTITNVNSFAAVKNINASSLAINQSTGGVIFSGVQTYTAFAGLNVTTSTSNGAVYLNNAVNLANNAQISINNSGILSIGSLGVISSVSGNISLGGSGGGKILLSSNISSSTGNIQVKNNVDLYTNSIISNTSGSVVFSGIIESFDSDNNGPSALTLVSSTNNATFLFSSTLGASSPLGAITVSSAKNVTFSNLVKCSSLTISDMTGKLVAAGNILISGNLTTNTTSNSYSIELTGSSVQISGATVLNHLGTTTLGDSNTDSFLFSTGLEELGAGGVFARGSFVSGGAMNFASEFTISGNNVGVATIDVGQDSVFYSRLNVQPNERLIKNGVGGIRLLNNTGGTFQGTFVANSGLISVLDDFSSAFSSIASGGTLSGIGAYGNISALSGVVAPGDSVGTLAANNLVANNLSTLAFQLGTISTDNDKLLINGNLTLSNASLSITPGQFLVNGQTLVIISNDGTDPVTGTFANLPEGSTYTSGNYQFKITYVYNDLNPGLAGNDVAVIVTANSNPVPPTPTPSNTQFFATAADAGGGPMVTVRFPTGVETSFFAYSPSFTGGVRISMGDINGDGFTDLVTGVGVGGGPHIKVWDLRSGTPIQVASFFAFESAFTGGLYLGVGNLNRDAYQDIIVGAGPGGGPRVSAFAGAQAFAINQNQVMTNFFAYSDVFRGGVTVAAADRNGDGLDEIVTGAGYGGGPNVSVFQLIQTTPNQFNPQLIQNFFVFDTTFTGGIFVAGGRFSNGTNSSGQILDDIFVGTGAGTKATVAVAFGTGGFYYLNPFGNFQGGARVGVSSSSTGANGINYLMAAAGPGGGPQVNIYNNSFALLDSFFAINPSMTLGVFANTNTL